MKTKHLPVWLLLIAIIPVLSFTTKNKAQDYRIAIGIAYGNMACNGLTVKTALGYEYKTAKGGSISEMSSQVRADVANGHSINANDVVMKTGYKPYAVIISYKKKISGWGCEKTMYAAGFGNSLDDATNDAVGNMEARGAAYSVLREITVY